MLAQVKFRKALGNRAFTCALLGISALTSLPAYSQMVPKDLSQGKAACEKELEDRFTFVENLDNDKKISPDEVNQNFLAQNCKANLESQVNALHGRRENAELREFALSKDASGAKYAGACELSHAAVKRHYETLKKKYLEYCDYVGKAGSELSSCDGVSSKGNISDCVSKLAKTEGNLKEKFESINKYLADAKNKLEMYQQVNQDLANKFDQDRARLAAAPPAAGTYPQLMASAGFENRLDDYKAALAPVVRGTGMKSADDQKGALIAEQILAQNNVDHYLEQIEKFKVDKHALSDKLNEQQEKLKKLQADMKSGGNDWTKLAGPAAAVAPAAQNLMPKNNTPAASSSGPGISGAVAAIPAAVALAGAAQSTSGASAAPNSASAAAPAAHDTPVTAFAGGSADTGTRSPASGTNDLKATDTPKTEQAAAGTYSPLGFSSDGSSRMGTLKKEAKSAGESPAPAQQANYANSAFDAGGGMIMSSRGGSSHSGPAPGAEVTNLLGQMKNLFNFDDPGSGGGGGVFGGAMPAMAPGAFPAGTEGAAGAEIGAETGATYPDSVAADGEPAAYEQGALSDNQPDSLFVRVHKRHRRYVERGLLVVNLGGIR